MAIEVQEEMVACSLCGLEVPQSEVQECFICHVLYCQYCGLAAYGHSFCSKRCRGFFFWGDGDHDHDEMGA